MKRFVLAMLVSLFTFFSGSAMAADETFLGGTIKVVDHMYYFVANPISSMTFKGDAVRYSSIDMQHVGGELEMPYFIEPVLNLKARVADTKRRMSAVTAELYEKAETITKILKYAHLGNRSALIQTSVALQLGMTVLPYTFITFKVLSKI